MAGSIRPGLATGRTASNAARQAIAGEQKASTKSVSMLSLGCPKNTVDGEFPSDGLGRHFQSRDLHALARLRPYDAPQWV